MEYAAIVANHNVIGAWQAHDLLTNLCPQPPATWSASTTINGQQLSPPVTGQPLAPANCIIV